MEVRGASSEVVPWVASSVVAWVACQPGVGEWEIAACAGVAFPGAAEEASYLALCLEDQEETACPSPVELQEAPGFLQH